MKIETKAVDEVNHILTRPSVMILQRATERYAVETDARDIQVDSALQEELCDANNQPIGYWPRTISEGGKKTAKTRNQSLVVIWEVPSLNLYLDGGKFTILAYHEALK